MSEEEMIDNGDATVTEETAIKEPSFHGRLQMSDFVFSGTAPRRSPRLQVASQQGPTSVSKSRSSTPASGTPSGATSLAPKAAARKRRAQREGESEGEGENEGKGEDDKEHKPLSTSSPRKKKSRNQNTKSAGYAPPSTYAHLSPLVDIMAPNLLVVFIGLNPGVQTARSGHAYAHPSNLFWRLLFSSGLTNGVACFPEEDRTLPARFSLGNTNIVARPSRNGAELSRGEMDEGVAALDRKCRRWRPEAVCLVGKGIWESVFRVRHRRNIARHEFRYGWQDDEERMGLGDGRDLPAEDGEEGAGTGKGAPGVDYDEPWEGARIFVATSTSGLAATLPYHEKERIWKILGDWTNQRRRERAEEKEGEGKAEAKDI